MSSHQKLKNIEVCLRNKSELECLRNSEDFFQFFVEIQLIILKKFYKVSERSSKFEIEDFLASPSGFKISQKIWGSFEKFTRIWVSQLSWKDWFCKN